MADSVPSSLPLQGSRPSSSTSGSSIALVIVIILISVVAYYLWQPPVHGKCSGQATQTCSPSPACCGSSGDCYDPNINRNVTPAQTCDPDSGTWGPCMASCNSGYAWNPIAQFCVKMDVKGCQSDSDCNANGGGTGINGQCSCDVRTGLCSCKPGYVQQGTACVAKLPCKQNGGACTPGENCDNVACGYGICDKDRVSCQCPSDPYNPSRQNWIPGVVNGNSAQCGTCNPYAWGNVDGVLAYGPGMSVTGDRNTACSLLWAGTNLLSNNCAYSDTDSVEGCNEFIPYTTDYNPINQQYGTVQWAQPTNVCDGSGPASSGQSCSNCANGGLNEDSRWLCAVTGWQSPPLALTPQTCPGQNAGARDPSSYVCCGGERMDCPTSPGARRW